MSTAPGFRPVPRADVGRALPAVEPLDFRRLGVAKSAYTTRFLSRLIEADPRGYGLLTGEHVVPEAGDVVLARVQQLGQHVAIMLPDGRRAKLFEGDEILVAYGDRYAPDQFEGEVPDNLGSTHLLAAGGLAGTVISAHASMKAPTQIQPLGLLTDAGGVVTLRRCAPLTAVAPQDAKGLGRVGRPLVIGVLGTSMNSGKTTTVASIVRGLTKAGLVVAAGKVTGTGAGGDPMLFRDSGASRVLDFTDFGYGSTYRLEHQQVRALLVSLIDELAAAGPDVVVVEIADGLFQTETARLVADPVFKAHVDKVVFAAGEALGATAGQMLLALLGLAPVAVSGMLTASPLARREAADSLVVPVLDKNELASASVADLLIPGYASTSMSGSQTRDRVAG
jgi:molybdopterin-guanine dinucleotide biosynthesis protein